MNALSTGAPNSQRCRDSRLLHTKQTKIPDEAEIRRGAEEEFGITKQPRHECKGEVFLSLIASK